MQQLIDDQVSRILVIDDNESIHDDFRKILGGRESTAELDELESLLFESDAYFDHGAEYHIDSALQGQEGLERVVEARKDSRPYATAFVDMRMPPGWDGLETIERLWEADPELQVVICTAYSDYSWQELMDRLGRSDRLLILKKPFDTVEVRQLAATLTQKWALDRQAKLHQAYLEATVADRTKSLRDTLSRLKQSRTFLQSTLNALTTQIGILDEHGILISVNEAWSSAATTNPLCHAGFAASQDYLAGLRSDPDLPESVCPVADGIQAVLSGERDAFSCDFRADGADGVLRCHTVRVTQFPHMESRRIVLAYDDVTEMKELERQLLQAQKLEAIGRLTAGVAHEINSPIQFVGHNIKFLEESFGELMDVATLVRELTPSTDQPSAELLSRLAAKVEDADLDYLADEIPTAIQQSLNGTERVSEIVRAMKEFSHPGQAEKTQVDIRRSIESTITVARSEWKHYATVETEFADELPQVPCYPGELNQVILNLIVNAAHAIADARGDDTTLGVIRLGAKVVDDHVCIWVADTGGGIPKEVQPRIFDPFFTTKEVGRGTGQGLAIAWSVVTEKHGGRLRFETTAGEGTTFFIELPLDE